MLKLRRWPWLLLGPKSAICTLVALRVQQWALILMAYHYVIEYCQSADHVNADALSRLPSKVRDGIAKEEEEISDFSIIEDLPVQANYIAHSTNKDPVLARAKELTLNGWPSHVTEETLVLTNHVL